VRERTSGRRQAAIPAVFLLGALLLAVLTAERGQAALPGEQSSLSVVDTMVTEGTGTTTNALFRVQLSAASSATVSVSYATADADATSPADYGARTGTLFFAPGETEKSVSVPVVSDALDEAHENFALDLSNADGATLADARGFATLVDDDPEPAVSVDDASASEGDALTFTVRLSASSGRLITVEYVTAPGSASAADYAAATDTLAFWPGESEKAVTLSSHEDLLVEGDESFSLSLLRPANVVLADAAAAGTIRDDDGAGTQEPPTGEGPGDPPGAANLAPDCSAVRPSTARLWSPNHKLRVVGLAGATDPDGDALALAVSGVTQDERVRGTGRGDRGPDAAWVSGRPHQVKLRAERSARGDGRVYRLAFRATDSHGAACSGTALVGVRHDARKPWVDSGAVFDSFGL
jgi:hypothetical protein